MGGGVEGGEFKGFTKGGGLILRPKLGGLNSVSGVNLHYFETICPARGVRTDLRTPLSYGPLFNVKSQRVIFPRASAQSD